MRQKEIWKRLLTYLKPYRFRLILIIGAAIVSTAFMVLAPYVIGLVTTTLLSFVKDGLFDWSKIISLLGILVLLYGISQLFSFFQGLGMAHVSSKVMKQIRQDIDEKMHKLPLRYYDMHTHGEILSTITNDVDTINNAISQNLTSIVTQCTTAIGVFFMMISMSPALSLIPILMVPLSLLSASGVMKASNRYYEAQQNSLGALNGFIEEMIAGQAIIQTFNYQERAIQQFEMVDQELKNSSRKAEITAGAINPITTLVSDLGYVLCAVLGCFAALSGKMTVGNVQAMLEYTWRFADPFATMAGMVGSFAAASAAGKRIFSLLDAQEEVPDPSAPCIPSHHQGSVVFKNVYFGYDRDVPLMKGINLEIQPGQKVAIVGPTGAGKTTLINLLMRFYDVDQGSIIVDGVDIRKMTRKELRSRFGMVLQDAWLLEGSIEENIGYAMDTINHERVETAAKMASVHSLIQTLPGVYQMKLNKGAENISQGERQLLTIARAIAADPEIMILDEATSNIDTHTEMLIQQAMDTVMKGKTSFIIAHRLSTIQNADIILYMEHGNIIEMGNHETLLQKQGKYAALYQSQFAH